MCAAITSAGIGLSYLAPMATHKFNIMKLMSGSAEDYAQKIDQIHWIIKYTKYYCTLLTYFFNFNFIYSINLFKKMRFTVYIIFQ